MRKTLFSTVALAASIFSVASVAQVFPVKANLDSPFACQIDTIPITSSASFCSDYAKFSTCWCKNTGKYPVGSCEDVKAQYSFIKNNLNFWCTFAQNNKGFAPGESVPQCVALWTAYGSQCVSGY